MLGLNLKVPFLMNSVTTLLRQLRFPSRSAFQKTCAIGLCIPMLLGALSVPAFAASSATTGSNHFAATDAPTVSFNALSFAPTDSPVRSNEVTFSGLSKPVAISIKGGEYSINGRDFVTTPGIIVNGAKLVIRVQTSALFGTTTTANVTIGPNTFNFSVTTQTKTPLTSVTQALKNNDPSAFVDPNGILVINGSPTQTFELRDDVPSNTVIQLATDSPITLKAGKQVLVYRQMDRNSLLITLGNSSKTIDLQIERGLYQIDSGAIGDYLPIGYGKDGTSYLQTQTNKTSTLIGRRQGVTVAYLRSGGKATYSLSLNTDPNSTSTNSPTTTGTNSSGSNGTAIFPGETLETNEFGSLARIRFGSPDGDQKGPGDPLTVKNADTNTVIPSLSGTLSRLNTNSSLLDVVQQGLNNRYGVSLSKISQSATTGVISFTAGNNSYRFIPLGQPTVVLSSAAPVNSFAATSSSASGSFTLTAQSISLTMASSLAYFTDLSTALTSLDPNSTLTLRSDGSMKIFLSGNNYVTVAGGVATGGNGTATPTFSIDASGNLSFIDSTNATQSLYPVFSDVTTVDSTAKSYDSTATATQNGDGTATLTIGSASSTLVPDYSVISTPAAHAAEQIWLDGSKVYIQYSDSTAQSFVIK